MPAARKPAVPALRSRLPRKSQRHPKGIRIDWDTPILPHIVAWAVCNEAAAWLGSPLPTKWVRELSARANTIYAHNERFRRRIRGAGNRGRDYLWMFVRHWLAALLQERRPRLFARLPASYSTGSGLPDDGSSQSTCRRGFVF